ncbi:MAG: hypothetical protein Q9183_006851 [Haloplaca sp. 2 TL-2023]
MPKGHSDNMKDLFRQNFALHDGIYERPYPIIEDSQVDCIHDLIDEKHPFPYIAEVLFKVQACSSLADIEKGFEPNKLTRIDASDIEKCSEKHRERKHEKKRVTDPEGEAWKHWVWIQDKMSEGTIDEAMRRLFVDAEKKYRGNDVKTVWVRDLRADYYQVVDHPPKYE